MTEIANIALDVLHISIILINLIGWSIPGWGRRLFMMVFSLTIVSWFGFGMFYGIGYCFLTDVHWSLKRQLGIQDLPYSYVTYLINLLGFQPDPNSVDIVVAAVFALLLMIYLRLALGILRKYRSA